MDVRDYNHWIREEQPVILMLYDASRERAYWLHVQDYFKKDDAPRPKKGAKTVRARIPARQVVNLRSVAVIRDLMREAINRPIGGQS